MRAAEVREAFLAELLKYGFYESWQNGGPGSLLQGYRFGAPDRPFSLDSSWAADVTARGGRATISVCETGRRRAGVTSPESDADFLPPDDEHPWVSTPSACLGTYSLIGHFPIGPDIGAKLVRWLAATPKHKHLLAALGEI